MSIVCAKCGANNLTDDHRIPPWCLKCGADLKWSAAPSNPAPSAATEQETPAPRQEPAARTAQAGITPRSLQTLADAERHAQLEKERRERCSLHNFAVGALLAAWGFLVGMSAAQDPTDKIFAAHPRLLKYLSWLQVATCVNGLVLCLVGYGIRNQRRWAYALGTGSACLLILGGVLFFVCFNRVGTGPTLVDSVARIRLIRENFDLLIGLVEGGALLMFLVRYSKARMASPGAAR